MMEQVFSEAEMLMLLESARIAFAEIPEDICDLMDISDDVFCDLRDKLNNCLEEPAWVDKVVDDRE